MAIEGSPTPETPSPWEVVRHEIEGGVAVRFIGRNALKACDVNELRKKVHAVLSEVGIDEERQYDAAYIISELGQNALRYGKKKKNDGLIEEVDVVAVRQNGTEYPETVDISVVNWLSRHQSLEKMERRGQLAAEEPLEQAEHGHGLEAIYALTNGRWGYAVSDDATRAGKKNKRKAEMHLVTHAVLSDFDEAA